jgi:SAM-dependent methyltransferase
VWSRLVGDKFIDWLAAPPGLAWIDIGCGNGAFTELLVDRCAPAEVQGVDISEGQLSFARARPAARLAEFRQGDAMAVPFPAQRFDAAVMTLVLVFLPEPAKGIAEMIRVVKPGGLVALYMWDMLGGGFPLDPIIRELEAVGVMPPRPPRLEASRLDAMQALARDACLRDVEARSIVVQRTFTDLDDLWATSVLKSPSLQAAVAGMPALDVGSVKRALRARLPADNHGRITYSARANAIKGRAPGER